MATEGADEPDRPSTREIAAASRRAARNLGRAADRDLPRLVVRRARRRDRPRNDDVFDRARDLVENTVRSQADIARQLELSEVTLIKWIQVGGWMRPSGAPAPFGGWRPSPGFRERMQARIEARRRMEEAERLLEVLGREETVGPNGIAAAFRALEVVLATLKPGVDGRRRAPRRGAEPRIETDARGKPPSACRLGFPLTK